MFGLSKYDGQLQNCLIAMEIKVAIMKIVVIGGTGLIGSKLVTKLREHGHEGIPASPNSGVNTLTGEGLAVRRWLSMYRTLPLSKMRQF